MRYSEITIDLVRRLRARGKTYGEINKHLSLKIPKSTLSFWCQNIPLPPEYVERIRKLNTDNFGKARSIANEMNKIKREEFIEKIHRINLPIAGMISDRNTAKIALAMLCLGEASKYGHSAFYLGNSDPRIVTLFIELLIHCYNIDINKIRCTVQCRADQDIQKLERYWQKVTGIPKKNFYKTHVDPRTIGKPTQKLNYNGVLRVNYSNSYVQRELESLAGLIYNIVFERARSSVGRAPGWQSGCQGFESPSVHYPPKFPPKTSTHSRTTGNSSSSDENRKCERL